MPFAPMLKIISFSPLDWSRPVWCRVRLALGGQLLRVLAALGFVVLLTGRSRAGKTKLLRQAFGSQVVDLNPEWMVSGRRVSFEASAVPYQGTFAIDEAHVFSGSSLAFGLASLAAFGRGFVVAGPLSSLASVGLFCAANGRPVVLVCLEERRGLSLLGSQLQKVFLTSESSAQGAEIRSAMLAAVDAFERANQIAIWKRVLRTADAMAARLALQSSLMTLVQESTATPEHHQAAARLYSVLG